MGNIRFGLHREYPPFLICFMGNRILLFSCGDI